MNTIQTQLVFSEAFSKGAFRLRFTMEQRAAQAVFLEAAKKAAADGTATVEQGLFLAAQKDWDDMLDGPDAVRLDDPNLIAAMDLYVALGLLTEAERDEVLGVEPAPE